MENRYLFRAKRIDNDEWVEGNLITDEEDSCHAYIGYLFGVIDGTVHDIDIAEVDPSTICQCTGLKDKTGKMIWENDILRYSYNYPDSPWLTDDDIKYRVGAVFFQERRGSWAVCGNGKSRTTNQDVFTYCRNPNRTEVIGNIFDNPELLEQED